MEYENPWLLFFPFSTTFFLLMVYDDFISEECIRYLGFRFIYTYFATAFSAALSLRVKIRQNPQIPNGIKTASTMAEVMPAL